MSKSITQDLLYRQSIVKYAIRHDNNAKAARKYKVNREYVRFWRNRYDGTLDSLRDKSRAPKNPRLKQSDSQLEIVKHTFKHNKRKQAIEMFVIAQKKGYKHSYYTFTKTVKRLFRDHSFKQVTPYKPKPYDTPTEPGAKVQVDIKYVPSHCYSHLDEKWYQYTFLDEATRIRFLYPAREKSTYEANKALLAAHEYFKHRGIRIQLVQTDNDPAFTNRFLSFSDLPTLFESTLNQLGIDHYKIRPYTPRHNGKVERSHRNDNERFYNRKTFTSFNDFATRLRRHNKNSNNFPIITLNFKTPNEILRSLVA